MSITLPGLRKGKHRGAAVLAGQTPTELKQHIGRLAKDNETVIEANELLVCELTRAVLRGCQDSMRIARLETELAAAVAEVKRLQQRVIRDAANVERLRQAVVDARPRVTAVDTQLVRPFAPEVVLPYISPVPVVVQHTGDGPVAFAEYDLPQQRRAS